MTISNKSKETFKFLKDSWPTVRKWLVGTLIKKFLPKIAGGVWGGVVTFFGGILFDKLLKPAWDYVFQKAHATWNKMKRKPKVKDFEEAKNESDFDRTFDDMP